MCIYNATIYKYLAVVARFLVATQDVELLSGLRLVPGVPLLRLHGGVPHVEEPSEASRSAAKASEGRKRSTGGWEKATMPLLQAREAKAKALAEAPKKLRKKKGPRVESVESGLATVWPRFRGSSP